jgi:hypothetical protein
MYSNRISEFDAALLRRTKHQTDSPERFWGHLVRPIFVHTPQFGGAGLGVRGRIGSSATQKIFLGKSGLLKSRA